MAEAVFAKWKKQIRALNVLSGVDLFEEREIWNVPAARFFFLIVVSFWICFSLQLIAVRDLLTFSLSMNYLGMSLQGVTTVCCVVFNKSKYNALFERVRRFHCAVSEDKGEEAVKERYRAATDTVIRLYVGAFLIGAVGIDFIPIPLNLITGEYNLPFGQNIPFLDPTTSPGYQITYVYQVFLTFLCVPNMCAFQNVYLITVGHFCCLVDVMVEKVVAKRDKPPKAILDELFELHSELLDLHGKIESLYGDFNTMLIMTTGFSLALGIIVLMRHRWIQGYIFIVMGFTNLLVACIYGYLVETKAEKLERALFDDFDWLALDTSDQRSLGQMLHMVQNKQQLCSGKLFVLGLDLYVLVVKRVYSLCMMLRQF